MALSKCKECGHRVSTKATACPSCGAPVKKNSGFGRVVLVLLVIMVGILFASNPQDKPNRQRRELSDNEDTALHEVDDNFQEGSQRASHTSVVVSQSRLIPFPNRNTGQRMWEVQTTWKNTGNTPVRAIDAIFTFRSKDKRIIARYDYTLYAVSDSDPGVAPGETYKTPKGQGFKFPDQTKEAASVEVEVTNAFQQSGI